MRAKERGNESKGEEMSINERKWEPRRENKVEWEKEGSLREIVKWSEDMIEIII